MTTNINIIGASAGSGKTFRLCEDYHACVSQEGLLPEQIVATTFTRKAAGELQQRLRQKLLEEGKVDLALAVADSRIGTVHSICLDLLGEHAFLAGGSPELEIIPDDAKSWVFKCATGAILESYATKYGNLFRRLGMEVRERPNDWDPKNWMDTVNAIVDLARANAISPAQVRAQAQPCKDSLDTIFKGKTLSGKKEQEINDALGVKLAEVSKAIREKKEPFHNVGEKSDKTVSQCASAWRKARAGHGIAPWKNWLELAGLPQKLAPLPDLASQHVALPGFRKDMRDAIDAVFSCAAEVMEGYAQWKSQRGLIDYNDMEAQALELLANPGVQKALAGQIRHVFVDEFQDTSPMQLQIFLQLAKIAEQSSWIGDIKQAIYGFRGTDPDLMQAASKALAGETTDILKDSWRSRPELVNFTNDFFEAAFAPHGMDKNSVILEPQRKALADTPAPLRCGILDGAANELAKGWQSLANAVAKMLGDGTALVAKSKTPKETQARPATPGDIAILCRTNTHCKNIAKALEARGVPVVVALDEAQSTPEIRLCLAAYRYCVRTEAMLPLLEMARLLHAADDTSWLGDALDTPDSLKKLACLQDILPQLDAIHQQLAVLAPSEALRLAIAALDMPRRVAMWGNTARRLANVDALVGMAQEYEASLGVNVTHPGCLFHLLDSNKKQDFAAGSDAVCVTTYHKSKGLEWPVVFLTAGLKGDRAGDRAFFAPRILPPDNAFDIAEPLKNRMLHFWPWPYGTKQNVPDTLALAEHGIVQSLRERDRREALRVLYVGMTRARDVLTLAFKRNSKGELQDWWAAEALPEDVWHSPQPSDAAFAIGDCDTHACLWWEFPAEEPADGDDATGVQATEDAAAVRIAARPAPGDTAQPYAPLVLLPSRDCAESTLKTADTAQLASGIVAIGATPVPPALDATDDATGEALRGTLLHAWLAVDMCLPATADREARAAEFMAQWQLPDAEAQEIQPLLLPMGDRLRAGLAELAKRHKLGALLGCRAEWPVVFRHTTQGLVGASLVRGTIDLLAFHKKGVCIIDHKFLGNRDNVAQDGAIPEAFCLKNAAHYAGQMACYRQSLASAGHGDNVPCYLHMPFQGALVPTP